MQSVQAGQAAYQVDVRCSSCADEVTVGELKRAILQEERLPLHDSCIYVRGSRRGMKLCDEVVVKDVVVDEVVSEKVVLDEVVLPKEAVQNRIETTLTVEAAHAANCSAGATAENPFWFYFFWPGTKYFCDYLSLHRSQCSRTTHINTSRLQKTMEISV